MTEPNGTAETVEVESQQSSGDEALESMGEEQLRELIDGNPPNELADETVQFETETPEEPAEEAAPEQEAVTEEAPADEPAEEEAVEIDDDPVADIRERMELQALDIQRLEKLLSRKDGEIGHKLQKKIASLEADNRRLRQRGQPREDTYDPDAGVDVAPEPEPAPEPRTRDDISAWAVQQAIAQAGQQFRSAYQGEPELVKEVLSRLQQSDSDAAHILEASDPMYAMQETSSLLERTYLDVKRGMLEQRRAEREQRRVDQAERLKSKKRAAAVSTSSSGSAGPPAPKTFDPEAMSPEELAKVIDSISVEPL